MQTDNLNFDLDSQEDIILDVLLAIMIGDWTGSNIENFVGGNEHLLKWDLYNVQMLPPATGKTQKSYKLNLAPGCIEDDGARAAKNYILKAPNRLTDDTMFSMALALTLILNREKYKLDQEFDERTYKKNLEELMADYTEMLMKFYRYYNSISICGPMMHKLLAEKLVNVPKDKLIETIREIKQQNKLSGEHFCESYANGSAMHSAPGAYVARTMEELDFIIEQTVKNTHDNPDAIKGAKVVAQFIFLARLGWDKETIAKWISYKFKVKGEHPCASYDTSLTLEDIKKSYFRTLECKYTVHPALIAVLKANSFEEAVNNARSIGGDSDTICAIAAQMAVALWPIPNKYKDTIKKYSLDVKTNGTLKLDLKNQTAQEFLSCNCNGKNNLFIKINDEFNKKFVPRYKGDDLISWRLKNTLSIVKNLEANLKNIVTEEKKNDLIDLLDAIEKDVKNKFAKAEHNVLNEISNLIEQIKSKIKEIDVEENKIKVNKNAGYYITPEGFIERQPEVIFVPYSVVIEYVIFGRKCYFIFNLTIILICFVLTVIFAIKMAWLLFGISIGIFLLPFVIDFVYSIFKFKYVNEQYYVSQNQIHDELKDPEIPLISENEPNMDNKKNTDLLNPDGV